MAQQAEQGGEIFAQHRVPPKKPAPQQHGQNRLQNIAENHHEGQPAAEGPVEVRQPGVAAAVVPHVVPEDILGHDDCAVEAA